MTKREQCVAWLKANPGKSRADWIIEERCPNDARREEFKKFLEFCDENRIELEIPSLRSFYAEGLQYDYDFSVKNMGIYYDVDAPDEVYTNEKNWNKFLTWKWGQVLTMNNVEGEQTVFHNVEPSYVQVCSFPSELEEVGQFQYVAGEKSQKWNHPDVLTKLKWMAKS